MVSLQSWRHSPKVRLLLICFKHTGFNWHFFDNLSVQSTHPTNKILSNIYFYRIFYYFPRESLNTSNLNCLLSLPPKPVFQHTHITQEISMSTSLCQTVFSHRLKYQRRLCSQFPGPSLSPGSQELHSVYLWHFSTFKDTTMTKL
jgi:hypothetical protein